MVGPKKQAFWPRIKCHQGKIFKKFLRVMTVRQKLGVILESKLVQKLSLVLILGQKACFLGPTIVEIPQPN